MKFLHRGEKGFTLLELLAVIAVVAVLIVVVILNLGAFTGTSAVTAGKTERRVLQKAVDAMMTEAQIEIVPADIINVPWQGETGTIFITGYDGREYDAGDYIKEGRTTKGVFIIDDTGLVTCASYPGLTDVTKINLE